jgi:hypothetical protein
MLMTSSSVSNFSSSCTFIITTAHSKTWTVFIIDPTHPPHSLHNSPRYQHSILLSEGARAAVETQTEAVSGGDLQMTDGRQVKIMVTADHYNTRVRKYQIGHDPYETNM